jgi:hypothetical protein
MRRRGMTRSAALTAAAEDEEVVVSAGPDGNGGAAAATPPPLPPSAAAGVLGWRRVSAAAVRVVRSQWFILCLGAVIGLAALTPEVGRTGGWIRSEYTVAYGCVVLIFFLTGLAVKLTSLRHALTAWRLLLRTSVALPSTVSTVRAPR